MKLKARAVVFAGTLGPLGYLPASGTFTVAVVGVPLFWFMHSWTAGTYLVATAVFTLASVQLHQTGDRILGEKDSNKLVWDELVGFMFAVALLPFTWQLAAIAFLAERTIDIVKVPPANYVEEHWPGGWGVVGDDVVAGLYTRAILQLIILVAPSAVGLS